MAIENQKNPGTQTSQALTRLTRISKSIQGHVAESADGVTLFIGGVEHLRDEVRSVTKARVRTQGGRTVLRVALSCGTVSFVYRGRRIERKERLAISGRKVEVAWNKSPTVADACRAIDWDLRR